MYNLFVVGELGVFWGILLRVRFLVFIILAVFICILLEIIFN